MSSTPWLEPPEPSFEKTYRRRLWWVHHRHAFGSAGLVALLVFDVVLLGYAGWVFLDTQVFSIDAERTALVETLRGEGLRTGMSPESLLVGDVLVFPSGDQADFYVPVSQDNEGWWVEFSYYFRFEGGQSPVQSGFLLPAEQAHPLLALGVPVSGSSVRTAELMIENMRWHRVDARQIPDYAAWSQDRLGWTIANLTFTRQEAAGTAPAFLEVSFEIQNTTAFGWWQPNLSVLLFRGNRVVGVERGTVSKLRAGETRQVTLRFPTSAIPTQVQILPELPLFDAEAYLPLGE